MAKRVRQLDFGLLCGQVASKPVHGGFCGGNISSDGGVILVRKADQRLGLTRALSACMRDGRAANRVSHELHTMLSQRVLQIACGYEDCNDADDLRYDPAFRTALSRLPETGRPLPSQPTLCRFENSVSASDLRRMANVFIDQFVARYASHDECQIILDFDATDDETHGQQQFAEFHGFYGEFCYLPLIVTAQVDDGPQELLVALLRRGRADAASCVIPILKRLVPRLRRACPKALIIVRGDGGFAKPDLYAWCDRQPQVYYEIAISENKVLTAKAAPHLAQVHALHAKTGIWTQVFAQDTYRAKTWPHDRRIVIKAEVTLNAKDETRDNPRFVVTNLTLPQAEALYHHYTQRGEASENRIKELKNGLKCDRTSCHYFLPNALRLMLHAAAYLLHCELRRGLKDTQLAKAQVATIQRKLLKVGVRVSERAQEIWLGLASNCPMQHLWPPLLKYLDSPVA